MKTDKKILLVKQWLDGGEALSLLEQLTDISIWFTDFLELIKDREVDFYVAAIEFAVPWEGLQVSIANSEKVFLADADYFKVVSRSLLAVIDRGEFLSPFLGFCLCECVPVIEGEEESTGRLVRGRPVVHADYQTGKAFAYFKPQDIQKLAGIINGAEQDTELEQLRQQAEKALSLQSEVSHLRSRLSQAEQNSEFLQDWKDRHGQDLEQLHQQSARNDAPADSRSLRSAGQIIAALAAMADVDTSKPYAVFESLSTLAATKGLEFPRSKETLKAHFENARKASKPKV